MTANQIIEVLQAWKQEKPLEWRYKDDKFWRDYDSCEAPIEFVTKEWRVEPEQRKPWEGFVLLRKNGEHTAHETSKYLNMVDGRLIKVREVVEE